MAANLSFRYDAYIAYSRLDRQFALDLQQNLERGFRKIVPQFRGNRKRFQICRDETDFTAGDDLPSGIRQKLSEAAALIVICSPNARDRSHWVAKEIEDFRESSSENRRVVAVVLAGQDPLSETAFPQGLVTADSPPLAVDFRPDQTPAEIPYKDFLKRDGVLRVLAPLLGVEYPILKDRQGAYERSQNRRRLGFVGLIAAVFGVLAVYAMLQRNAAVDRLAANYWSQGVAALRESDPLRATEMYALASDTTRDARMRTDARFAVARLTRGLHLGCRAVHAGPVRGLLENSQGTRFLTWSDDGTARIWKADNCSLALPPMHHGAPIVGAAFDMSESIVLTYSLNGHIRIWNTSSGEPIQELVHGTSLAGAQFSGDGKWLVVWGKDNSVDVSEVGHDGVRRKLQHPSEVLGVLLSPDGRMIATWCLDESLRIWEIGTGALIGGPWPNAGRILGAEFRADGGRLLTWNLFGAADLWNTNTFSPVAIPRIGRSSSELAAYSTDGRKVLVWNHEGGIAVRDGTSGRLVCGPIEHQPPGRVDATFNEDGTRFLSWSIAGTARVWSGTTCRPISPVLDAREPIEGGLFLDNDSVLTWDLGDSIRAWSTNNGGESTPPMVHHYRLHNASFDRKTGIVLSRSLNSAELWDPRVGNRIGAPMFEGEEIYGARIGKQGSSVWTWGSAGFATRWDLEPGTVPYRQLSHEDNIVGIRRLDSADRLLTWTSQGVLRLWNVGRAELAVPPMNHGPALEEVNTDEKQSRIVSVGSDGVIRVWQISTGKLAREQRIKDHGTVLGSSFSPDGARLAVWTDEPALLLVSLNMTEPEIKKLGIGGIVRFAKFSEDGGLLVACDSESCSLWRGQDGSAVGRMKTTGPTLASVLLPVQLRLLGDLPKTGPREATFMEGHSRLATFDSDGTVRVWDTSQAKPVGSDMKVAGIALSPDGRLIAAWSGDGTIQILRSLDKTRLLPPLSHGSRLKSVVWIPDSSGIVSWTDGNVVHVWSARTGRPLISPLRHDAPISGATLSEDQKLVITWCTDGTVRAWSLASGLQIGSTMRHPVLVDRATVSPDGSIVIAAAGKSLSLSFTADGSDAGPGLIHPDPVREFFVFSNPLRIVTSTGSRSLWWWNLGFAFPERTTINHVERVLGTNLDPRGATSAVAPR